MLHLLFIVLPIVIALYSYLLGRQRRLVIWAAGLAIILVGYLGALLPLDQPIRLLGGVFSMTRLARLFDYAFLLMAAAVIVAAHALHQGDLPIPIGLFILGITNTIVLLDDPIVIALLLEVVGLAIVLGTVDRPQEPVGLLPVPALMTGLKYLTMMVLSGIALVLGFLMLSLFQEMPQQLAYAKMALGLLVVGFGLGTAVVPFHLWFPDLAGHTSTAVTSLLVSLVQGAGLILLGEVLWRVPELLQNNVTGSQWLTGGAVVAGIAAALLATGQDRLKRLAAYAASYDVAVILFAFGLANAQSFRAGFFLAIHHGLALILLLTCIGVLEWGTGRDDVAGLVGIAYRMPLVALGLVVATLSLAGIPPWGGFVGRWPLYIEALSRGWIYLAGLFLAAALFLLAMVRALWPAFLPTEQTVPFRKPPWTVLAVIATLIVVLLLLGLYPNPVLAVLREATAGTATP
jgi:multicomponent Na+:H+ antiporter subunit D